MSTRREFLQKMSLMTVGGIVAANTQAFGAINDLINPATANAPAKQLGLQIYSVQRELYDDLPKRLRALQEMGYSKLELAGYNNDGKIGQVDMAEFKKIAEDAGQKILSSHVNPNYPNPYTKEGLAQAREYWKKTAEQHAAIGCKYVVQASMPQVGSYDDALLVAEYFNEAGRICKAAGMVWGYHNHSGEFQRVMNPNQQPVMGPGGRPRPNRGEQIMDILIANTDPEAVTFQIDVYWVVRGGNDPLEYMKNFKNRIKTLHIKDTSVLGQSGLLNFENIFNQMYTNGIEDYFVELERMPDGRTSMEGIKDCADYLLKMPFVK